MAVVLGFSTGLLTPFRRGPADFISGSGLALIKSKVGQVLGTQAGTDFSTGELPWRGAFGSRLHFLRHRPNTPANRELARVWAIDALKLWVPAVRVKDVTTSKERGPNGQDTVIMVSLIYDVVGSRGETLFANVPQNVSLRQAS